MRLWYRDEAQFEQALKSGEIPMGQYYHDVTGSAIADGFHVRSTFPKEGGVNDAGSWAVSRASKKTDEAHVFIDYMCRPVRPSRAVAQGWHIADGQTRAAGLERQGIRSRLSAIEPIIPRYDVQVSKADWLNQKWTELIVG